MRARRLSAIAIAAIGAAALTTATEPAERAAYDPGSLARRMGLRESEPAQRRGDAFVVLYSGDGGQSRGDRAIARALADDGLPVVDVNSLAYFWKRRTPGEAAADLAAVITQYSRTLGTAHVVVAGFSFGASAAPLIVGALPTPMRPQVRAVVLVGPRDYAELVVRPNSWLNIRGASAQPLAPTLAGVAWTRVVCVYGTKDRLQACTKLPGRSVTPVELAGGHHFGRAYGAVAAVIAQAAEGAATR
jgi:type IV secretory pathway VirJ component